MASTVRLIAVAAAFVALAEPAGAQGPPLKSAGAQFCRKALRPHGGIDPAAVQWTMGFVYGRLSNDGPEPPHPPFGGPDGIRARLIAYCHKNPYWQVADGAVSFFP